MRNLVPSFVPLPHPSSSRSAFWGLLSPRGGRLGGVTAAWARLRSAPGQKPALSRGPSQRCGVRGITFAGGLGSGTSWEPHNLPF